MMLDKLALTLIIIGALIWGGVGLFQFDIIAWMFGGSAAVVSRVIYVLVALAGLYCISLFFRRNELVESHDRD